MQAHAINSQDWRMDRGTVPTALVTLRSQLENQGSPTCAKIDVWARSRYCMCICGEARMINQWSKFI